MEPDKQPGEPRRVSAKAIAVMVCEAAAVLIAVGLALLFLLLNFGNGIKGAKLAWFLITHPWKWLSFKTALGFPVWEVLAVASVIGGVVLAYELIRLIGRPLSGAYPMMRKVLLGGFLIVAIPLIGFSMDSAQQWVMKYVFDYETKFYVLTGLQNDYERWLRKRFTVASEQEIHQDLLTGFRYYFRGQEREQLEDDMMSDVKKVDWWFVEYGDLIEVLKRSPRRLLTTPYRAGAMGNREATLNISIADDGSMTLQLDLPLPQSSPGDSEPARFTTVMKDRDRDGVPDEFRTDPVMEWGYSGSVSGEGFMPLAKGAGFEVVYGLWSQGMGYAINHFLHGYDSALPRGLEYSGQEV